MTSSAQPENKCKPAIIEQTNTDDSTTSTKAPALSESERKIILLVYILQAAGFVVGISFIAAVIVNYVKRGDLQSPIAKDHCNYQIRTFWWSTLWCVLSLILAFVLIGYFTAIIAILWTVYRVVRGFIRLNDGKLVTGK